MALDKGIIFYTDSRLDEKIAAPVREQLFKAELPIVSVSLKPLAFGRNIVLDLVPSYPTMVRQILAALEASTSDIVFFCEHDVLYSPTHFDFTPERDDTYYYNENNWRWDYPKDRVIRYDGLTSLSQLCCDRELALKHYQARLRSIEERGFDKIESRDPQWARIWGYEPGTKKRRNGGFMEEKSERWHSRFPNIDIRHRGTFSPPKVELESFKHKPSGWKESSLNKIHGWSKEYLWSLAS